MNICPLEGKTKNKPSSNSSIEECEGNLEVEMTKMKTEIGRFYMISFLCNSQNNEEGGDRRVKY